MYQTLFNAFSNANVSQSKSQYNLYPEQKLRPLPPRGPVSLPEPGTSRTRKARNLSLALLGTAAFFVLLKGSALEKIPRLCPWYNLSGTDCPFCGLIRSLAALGSGNLSQAAQFHPFGPLVAAFGLAVLAGSLYRWRTGREPAVLSFFDNHTGRISILVGICWLLWWLLGIL